MANRRRQGVQQMPGLIQKRGIVVQMFLPPLVLSP